MANDNRWDNLLLQKGGLKQTWQQEIERAVERGRTIATVGRTPEDRFFSALEKQWRPYDMLFIVPNNLGPGQDPESVRAGTDEALQGIVEVSVDAMTRHYAGQDLFVLPRQIGVGAWTFTPPFNIDGPMQLEVTVETMLTEMPVLINGVSVEPGERRLAMVGKGNRETLTACGDGVRSSLRPTSWGWCFGGDPEAPSAKCFLIVSLTGPELQRVLGIDGAPPAALRHWLERVTELWDRTKETSTTRVQQTRQTGGRTA